MMHCIKKAGDMHAGKWNGLGGKLLPGETPEQCAVREVKEESGLTLIKPVWRGVLTFPAFNNNEDWYAFVFVCRYFTGKLIDSDEGVLAWIEDEKLLDLHLWEGDKIFLKWLDLDLFFSGQFIYRAGKLVDHDVTFYMPDRVSSAPGLPGQQPGTVSDPQHLDSFSKTPRPLHLPADDVSCWICGGPVVKRHCKIICQTCGFTRDCSDP